VTLEEQHELAVSEYNLLRKVSGHKRERERERERQENGENYVMRA
jgi:hypothetical protein